MPTPSSVAQGRPLRVQNGIAGVGLGQRAREGIRPRRQPERKHIGCADRERHDTAGRFAQFHPPPPSTQSLAAGPPTRYERRTPDSHMDHIGLG